MKTQIISFHCVLKDRVGHLISTTFNKDIMTHLGGIEGPLPALAEGLQNLQIGEKRKIFLSAENAYGFYDPKLVKEVSRSRLAPSCSGGVSQGDRVFIEFPGGQSQPYRVTGINRDIVTLDGNHPLAGQDLIFEIEATEARDATPEEIAESRLETPARLLH